MKVIDRLENIHKEIKKYEGLIYNGFHLCVLYHYDYLKLVAWKTYDDINDNDLAIEYIIKNGNVKLINLGKYSRKQATEIKNHLENLVDKEELYTVEIKETLSKLIKMYGTSEEDAIKNAIYQYNNGEIVLGEEAFIDAEIDIYKG